MEVYEDHIDAIRAIQSTYIGYSTRKLINEAKNEYQQIFNEIEGEESLLGIEWSHDGLCRPLILKKEQIEKNKLKKEAQKKSLNAIMPSERDSIKEIKVNITILSILESRCRPYTHVQRKPLHRIRD